MRKIVSAFIIVISLFVSSCGSSPNTAIPIATSTIQETATSAQLLDLPTPEITPTLGKLSDENDGLIITLGERVDSPWWPAIPAFSPDGEMVALVSERVRLWNVETHEQAFELVKPYSNCYNENVAFSTNGNLLATSIFCPGPAFTGHVLIWDTESGILLHDWEQVFSKNTSKVEGILTSRPVTGIAFLPESSILAFANGNTIEMRDLQKNSGSVVLELGNEMFATDLAISGDGKRLFVFMDFLYDKAPNELGNKLGQKYALQTWDLESKKLVDKIEFPEPGNTGFFAGHFDVEMKLSGKFLLKTDYINKAFTVTDLETGETRSLHYHGDIKSFISQDANYVIYLPEFDDFNCKNQSIELWDTKDNQALHDFKTSGKDFDTQRCYGPNTIIFNPNNTILAIAHEERVSLFDISSFTKSQENGTP